MSRQLKRVALTFNWPLHKPWTGYLNTLAQAAVPCPACRGTGLTQLAHHLHEQWYGNAPFRPEDRGSTPFQSNHPAVLAKAKRNTLRTQSACDEEALRLCGLFNDAWMHHLNEADVAALLAANRLTRFTHTWSPAGKWAPKTPAYTPTPQEVNEWSIDGFGHDATNCCVCVQSECLRQHQSYFCAHCAGESRVWPFPDDKRAADQWKPTEPPPGAGYQMWETVSEGSPISPVFVTPEGLATWLAENRAGSVDEGTTADQWLAMIAHGDQSPSVVMTENGMQTGVQALY